MRIISRSIRLAALSVVILGGVMGLMVGNIDWPASAPAQVAVAGAQSGAIDWP